MRKEYRIIAAGLAAVLAVNIYAPIHVKALLFPIPVVSITIYKAYEKKKQK